MRAETASKYNSLRSMIHAAQMGDYNEQIMIDTLDGIIKDISSDNDPTGWGRELSLPINIFIQSMIQGYIYPALTFDDSGIPHRFQKRKILKVTRYDGDYYFIVDGSAVALKEYQATWWLKADEPGYENALNNWINDGKESE